jgi:hypothetical protein
MPVNYGHSEDGLNLTLVFSSWIGPMLDRLARDIQYCMDECGMSKDEGAELWTLFPHLLTLVALQQPKGIKTNMAQGLCREIMQGR